MAYLIIFKREPNMNLIKLSGFHRSLMITLTMLLMLNINSGVYADDISEIEKANIKLVSDFYNSWPTSDMKKITSYLTDDAVYTGLAHHHQSENPVLKGKQAFKDYWWSMIKDLDAQTIELVRASAIGNTVMTERNGSATTNGKTYYFNVGTIFYIVHGKIKTFTEYHLPQKKK